jgi:hypothetical protein
MEFEVSITTIKFLPKTQWYYNLCHLKLLSHKLRISFCYPEGNFVGTSDWNVQGDTDGKVVALASKKNAPLNDGNEIKYWLL